MTIRSYDKIDKRIQKGEIILKRWTTIVLFMLLLFVPLRVSGAGSSALTEAVNKQFKDTLTYYKNGSVQILDSMTTSTEVTENDTKTTKTVQVVLAQGSEIRDSLFVFHAKQIFYYDADSQKLLDSASLSKNEDIKQFEKKHKGELGKKLSPLSFTVLLVALLLTITFPPLVAIWFYGDASISHRYTSKAASMKA
ncbi:hypothetical protein ETC03_06400 [Geobacillus sp. MMMUD3]|nr:hypothetical protein [Geobacillus sp. MMMUD3]